MADPEKEETEAVVLPPKLPLPRAKGSDEAEGQKPASETGSNSSGEIKLTKSHSKKPKTSITQRTIEETMEVITL